MKTAILTIGTKSDIQFLIELAKKLGIKTRLLSPKEVVTHGHSKPNEYFENMSFHKFLG